MTTFRDRDFTLERQPKRLASPDRESAPPHEHVTQWAVGDGATTTFFLSRSPRRQDDLAVYVNGSLKRPDDRGTAHDYAFTPGTNKVTFTAAPTNTHPIAFLMIV